MSSVPRGSIWRVVAHREEDLVFGGWRTVGLFGRNTPTLGNLPKGDKEFVITPGTFLLAVNKMNCPDNPFGIVVHVACPRTAYINAVYFDRSANRVERIL